MSPVWSIASLGCEAHNPFQATALAMLLLFSIERRFLKTPDFDWGFNVWTVLWLWTTDAAISWFLYWVMYFENISSVSISPLSSIIIIAMYRLFPVGFCVCWILLFRQGQVSFLVAWLTTWADIASGHQCVLCTMESRQLLLRHFTPVKIFARVVFHRENGC